MINKNHVIVIIVSMLLLLGIRAFAGDMPEWEGVYIKNSQGHYAELKEVSLAKITSFLHNINCETNDFSIIPVNDFKGIYVKDGSMSGDVYFKSLRRNIKAKPTDPSDRSLPEFDNKFTLSPSAKIFELRRRQEAADAYYYEPPVEAIRFFGTADEGDFVLLQLGNRKSYIFGFSTRKSM